MGEMKVQIYNCCLLFLRVLTTIPSTISFSCINLWDCKKQFDFFHKKDNSVLLAFHYFSRRNWQLLEKGDNLQPLRKNCEEHLRSKLAQNSNVPRSQEEYITQVSEEIEGKLSRKSSQEYSRTESRILGTLSRLDDFLLNPFIPGHSGTTLEPLRRPPGTHCVQTRQRMGTTPRVILILKRVSFRVRLQTLAQMMLTTAMALMKHDTSWVHCKTLWPQVNCFVGKFTCKIPAIFR